MNRKHGPTLQPMTLRDEQRMIVEQQVRDASDEHGFLLIYDYELRCFRVAFAGEAVRMMLSGEATLHDWPSHQKDKAKLLVRLTGRANA
jgi:hypothetical protein